MPRIDIRNISTQTLKDVDTQRTKYGISNRAEYIRLLIHLDLLTDMLGKFNVSEKLKEIEKGGKDNGE